MSQKIFYFYVVFPLDTMSLCPIYYWTTMSLLKGDTKMRRKPEIKEKLTEAEKSIKTAKDTEQNILCGVILALRWVLGLKITQEPKDPVSGK